MAPRLLLPPIKIKWNLIFYNRYWKFRRNCSIRKIIILTRSKLNQLISRNCLKIESNSLLMDLDPKFYLNRPPKEALVVQLNPRLNWGKRPSYFQCSSKKTQSLKVNNTKYQCPLKMLGWDMDLMLSETCLQSICQMKEDLIKNLHKKKLRKK